MGNNNFILSFSACYTAHVQSTFPLFELYMNVFACMHISYIQNLCAKVWTFVFFTVCTLWLSKANSTYYRRTANQFAPKRAQANLARNQTAYQLWRTSPPRRPQFFASSLQNKVRTIFLCIPQWHGSYVQCNQQLFTKYYIIANVCPTPLNNLPLHNSETILFTQFWWNFQANLEAPFARCSNIRSEQSKFIPQNAT